MRLYIKGNYSKKIPYTLREFVGKMYFEGTEEKELGFGYYGGDRHELLDVKFPEKNEPKLRLEAKDDYKKTHDYKTDLEKIRGDK